MFIHSFISSCLHALHAPMKLNSAQSLITGEVQVDESLFQELDDLDIDDEDIE